MICRVLEIAPVLCPKMIATPRVPTISRSTYSFQTLAWWKTKAERSEENARRPKEIRTAWRAWAKARWTLEIMSWIICLQVWDSTLESSSKIIKACTQEKFKRWDRASKAAVKAREPSLQEISPAGRFSRLLTCREWSSSNSPCRLVLTFCWVLARRLLKLKCNSKRRIWCKLVDSSSNRLKHTVRGPRESIQFMRRTTRISMAPQRFPTFAKLPIAPLLMRARPGTSESCQIASQTGIKVLFQVPCQPPENQPKAPSQLQEWSSWLTTTEPPTKPFTSTASAAPIHPTLSSSWATFSAN